MTSHRSIVLRSAKRGFTLIEILIVVIILGILAAIVIPQFANASTQAKQSTVQSTAQTLRTQVALYKLNHNDVLPGTKAGAFDGPTFWTQMTTKTDAAGAAYVAGTSTSGPFGPYMQTTPTNALSSSSLVVDGTGNSTTVCGYVFDWTGGSGNLWGTSTDGKTILP